MQVAVQPGAVAITDSIPSTTERNAGGLQIACRAGTRSADDDGGPEASRAASMSGMATTRHIRCARVAPETGRSVAHPRTGLC
jgi:hypothetical protein